MKHHGRLTSVQWGIVLSLVAMALFSFNDTLGKWLVAKHPVGQVLVLRSLGALAVLVPMMMWTGSIRAVLRLEKPRLQALRVLASSVEVACFYIAVRGLALADVMAFWLAAPIWVALLSPVFLGERLHLAQGLAIAVGFVGVLVILGPGAGGAAWPVWAIVVAMVGTVSLAGMVMTGRSLRRTPDMVLAFWQLVGAGGVGMILTLAPFPDLPWRWPSGFDLMLLCSLGVVAMGAHLCLNRSVKLAPAAVVAPVQYTLLLWAVLLGWIFFGDLPTAQTIAGSAIIIVSGFYLFSRPMPAQPGQPLQDEIQR